MSRLSLRRVTSRVLVRAACVVGLLSLGLLAWPLFVPRTVPVLVSMSVGQGLGALALLCYLGAILLEVKDHEELAQKVPPASGGQGAARGGGSEG